MSRHDDDILELLSAHLDGELDESERRRIDEALDADPDLERELAELAATRALLRSLGPVEAPAAGEAPAAVEAPADEATVVELDDRRPGRRRVPRIAVAGAAVAAGWFVFAAVGAALGRPAMVPDVEALARTHMGVDEAMGFESVDVDTMDDPAVLDDVGAGMGRSEVLRSGETVLTRYGDGAHEVSVFHEPGTVDWEGMPADGTMEEMPVGKVWKRTDDDVVVVVVERGDLVVTVVSDASMGEEMALQASAMVPEIEAGDGMIGRLLDGPENILDRI